MRIQNINIIKNNDRNAEIINRLVQKTLNAKTIRCSLNEEESKKLRESFGGNSGFVLTYVNPKGIAKHLAYDEFWIDMEDEKKLEQFFIQLKFLCDDSVRKIPSLKTSQGIELNSNNWWEDYKKRRCEKMYAIIYNLVYWSWDKYNQYDILDMATSIFIRFAKSQELENGNKRFTVLFTTAFLAYFNIYIFESWNEVSNEYISKWENLVSMAATSYYMKKNLDGLLEEDYDKGKISDEELFSFVRDYLEKQSYFKLFK